MNLRTKVVYRNKNLEQISECEYDLHDYTDVLSMDLKRIISDIEDMIYMLNGGKSKSDWSENELMAFNKIKHKILDKSGEIARLPDCIFDSDKETNTVSNFWDTLFNKKGD